MVTRPAASPPMEMSKKTCERGASGVSMHRAHAQGQQRRTLLVILGPFFAAEAVARQATISLSGDIVGDAWQKLEQGVSLVTGEYWSRDHSRPG